MFERDKETERQRDRGTERQRDRETERQRDRETERQRGRETADNNKTRADWPIDQLVYNKINTKSSYNISYHFIN